MQERDDLYAVLASLELPNLQPASDLAVIQQQWLSGQMTNFDYLTQINKMAGRSLNDLMQYPIFPFIFAQYDKPRLDLTNAATFRFFYMLIVVSVMMNLFYGCNLFITAYTVG